MMYGMQSDLVQSRLFEKIIDPIVAGRVEKVLDEVFVEFNVDGLADEVGEMVKIG